MAKILLSALSVGEGGGLTYLCNIVDTFPVNAQDRLSVLCPRRIAEVPQRPDVEWIMAPRWTALPFARFLLGVPYFRFFWQRRRDFDAVYYVGGSVDASLPRRTKTVVAFRNMLPFDRAATRASGLGWLRLRLAIMRAIQSRAFRRADLIVFISDYARGAIDSAIPRRRGASITIPHGVSLRDGTLDPRLAERLPERFVLYLSRIEPYKAQLELIEAWARLRRIKPVAEKLVLAGPERASYGKRVRDAIARHGLGPEVVILGPVDYDQVFDLAGRAVLNLFLSTCENCPNILLEMMCAGHPLLVSSDPPMPAMGGPELVYADPRDPDAVAAALETLLADEALRQRLGAAARRRSQLFDWKATGARIWSAILELARPVRP